MQNLPSGSDIQSHEAFSSRIEHFTVIQSQTGLVAEQRNQAVMIQVQITAVKPYEEGSLWAKRLDLRKSLLAEGDYMFDVAFDIKKRHPRKDVQ